MKEGYARAYARTETGFCPSVGSECVLREVIPRLYPVDAGEAEGGCAWQEIIDDLELMYTEHMAGGSGDLEGSPALKALLDEAEGYATDAMEWGREVEHPNEFLVRYSERGFKDSDVLDE